MHGTEKQKQ